MVTVIGCMDSDETIVSIASILVPDGLIDLILIKGSTFNLKDELKEPDAYDHNDALLPPLKKIQW